MTTPAQMSELYYSTQTITNPRAEPSLRRMADITLSFLWFVQAELLNPEPSDEYVSPYDALVDRLDVLPKEVQLATVEAFRIALSALEPRYGE